MSAPKEKDRPRFSTRTALCVAAGVVALWALTPFAMRLFVENDLGKLGQAGDLFGSVNALFSGLAFAGVIVAILLQREELTLQREELTLTREELTKSAKAQDESQKALNKSIYAQSYKVAMEILEPPEMVSYRKYVWMYLRGRRNGFSEWLDSDLQHADLVGRSWETVATMIHLGTLPSEYMIQTWSVPIARYWHILGPRTVHLRTERGDAFIGQNFEWMAGEARKYLISKGVPLPEDDPLLA
jgi:hypothetical protein